MLYETIVTNQDGIEGQVRFSDNLPLATKHPLTDGVGYNPEQLIASAWSTCLNATIQARLDAKNRKAASRVEIQISLCEEENQSGYYFQVDTKAAIQGLNLEEAESIVQEAHSRCPISKLLIGAPTLTLKVVAYD